MTVGAQLSVTDQRRMARHPVDHPVIAEHFGKGDVRLHIANISANGFMIDNAEAIGRGERVIVRLPVIGRIEAYCIWVRDNRAGFQFERDHPRRRFPRDDRHAPAQSALAQDALSRNAFY